MSRRDPDILLDRIQYALNRLKRHVGTRSKQDFLGDEKTQDAVNYQLAAIGEIIKNLDTDLLSELTEKCPGVPWNAWPRLRDFLAHNYWNVDPERIWKTVEIDIPQLESAITQIKAEPLP